MVKNILIVGDQTDLHVVSVCKFLKEQEVNIIFLNPYEGSIGNITYLFSPFKIVFNYGGKRIDHTKINAVWWRLKPNSRGMPENIREASTESFISREWHLTIEPLSYFMKDSFWINKRSSDMILRNKPYQLYRAALHGFTIPKSIISNNYNFIAEAAKQFDEIIYKPLGHFLSPEGKILYSNKMTRLELEESEKNISIAPCIFQSYVDKDYELRITVVNNTVFAVKIYSQENELSKSDWRRNQFELRYEAIDLDKAFELKLLQFHKAVDIVFGAYDFIVDKKGDYIFLEVNHVGQWLWLEYLLHIQISKQIAHTLLQGN